MIFKLSKALSLSFPANEGGIIISEFQLTHERLRSTKQSDAQRGRPNMAAVAVGQPAVLAGIIATPVT